MLAGMNVNLDDRIRGCLLGLAVGDAVGTTLEFQARGTFRPITDMAGGGPFHLRAGEWTDDTSMALCLAESLVTKKNFDPIHQLETYVRWWRDGHLSVKGRCFDIGNATRGALYRFSTCLIAYDPGNGWSYFPSVGETLLTTGFVAFEILAYVYLIKRFPILAGETSRRPAVAAPSARPRSAMGRQCSVRRIRRNRSGSCGRCGPCMRPGDCRTM